MKNSRYLKFSHFPDLNFTVILLPKTLRFHLPKLLHSQLPLAPVKPVFPANQYPSEIGEDSRNGGRYSSELHKKKATHKTGNINLLNNFADR